jgi:hypothetical protein
MTTANKVLKSQQMTIASQEIARAIKSKTSHEQNMSIHKVYKPVELST